MIRIGRLPPGEAKAAFAAFQKKIDKSDNPLVRLALPAVRSVYERQQEGMAQFGKLRSAIEKRFAD